MRKVPKVLVVGAGPGGLAVAMLLAGQGFSVEILESKDVPGGRMSGLEAEGYAFDTGPTILQLPQILDQIFTRSGRELGRYVDLMPVKPSTRIHFWDGTRVDTFQGRTRNRNEWERLVPGGGERFDRFYAEHEKKYAIAYDRFIAHDASSIPGYFNPLRLLPAAKYMPWESLHRSLMRTLGDERLVYAMSYPSKYLGLHPTTCSSVFSVVPFLELAFGVWHPRGGFRALARGMQRAFEDAGGSIRFGARVRRVIVEKGEARGVVLDDGERIGADHVIVNADWALAKSRLLAPEDRPTHSDESIARRPYSCSTFMLYLGLDRVYENVPHHAIHLSNAVRRTDRSALEDRELDRKDAPFYVCNSTVTDPSNAPKGHSALYVLVPTPNTSRAIDWQREADSFANHAIERLALVGFDDLAKHVRVRRIATAETWRDDFDVYRGAVFNLAHGWTQLGPLRPRCRDEDVVHLHWVGGGTHPGSGLLTIFESANIAARDVAARFGGSLAPSRAPRSGDVFTPKSFEARSESVSRSPRSASPRTESSSIRPR
ncbi:phytoene desaturase family protein [soil metagenome]